MCAADNDHRDRSPAGAVAYIRTRIQLTFFLLM
jgi:hypothetical protein